MRIQADKGRCVGAGMCALTAPALFDQSEDDGTVIVLHPDPPPALRDAALRAVHSCPSTALSLSGDLPAPGEPGNPT
ncbi:ferredoxin [Sphaerisporangium aureirubrum]|uniref:Ferredoxin n=1 Tax=Sphaerisporangium aureirubrum TaxID=1544736 RepID=A0ABW1NNM5_9ACTN